MLQPFSRFHNEEKVDGDRDKEDDKQRGFDHFSQEFAAHPKPDSANLASQAARMKPCRTINQVYLPSLCQPIQGFINKDLSAVNIVCSMHLTYKLQVKLQCAIFLGKLIKCCSLRMNSKLAIHRRLTEFGKG